MSSYVSSPYEIEERRLRGIVSDCEADLARSLQEVQAQQNVINNIEQARIEEFNQYQGTKTVSDIAEEANIKANKIVREEKIERLKQKLADMQIELAAFENHYGSMPDVVDKQNSLLRRLEDKDVNLEKLEHDIDEHIQYAEGEVVKKSSEMFMKKIKQGVVANRVVRGEKGVSLKSDAALQGRGREKKTTPADEFAILLKKAKESPFYGKVKQIEALRKEFEDKKEFERPAFAVRNMKKLAELCDRLAKLEAHDTDIVVKYKAICKLLDVTPDKNILAGPINQPQLEQECQKMMDKYQEKKKREYVSEALATVFARHGIEYQDGMEDELQFSMGNITLNVNGVDSNYLTMEVEGQYNGDAPTLDEKRKSVATANHFCSLLAAITEELKDEYGVTFKNITTEKPSETTIVMKKSKTGNSNRNYHSNNKQMTVD